MGNGEILVKVILD